MLLTYERAKEMAFTGLLCTKNQKFETLILVDTKTFHSKYCISFWEHLDTFKHPMERQTEVNTGER